jgi:hypothetical protein
MVVHTESIRLLFDYQVQECLRVRACTCAHPSYTLNASFESLLGLYADGAYQQSQARSRPQSAKVTSALNSRGLGLRNSSLTSILTSARPEAGSPGHSLPGHSVSHVPFSVQEKLSAKTTQGSGWSTSSHVASALAGALAGHVQNSTMQLQKNHQARTLELWHRADDSFSNPDRNGTAKAVRERPGKAVQQFRLHGSDQRANVASEQQPLEQQVSGVRSCAHHPDRP